MRRITIAARRRQRHARGSSIRNGGNTTIVPKASFASMPLGSSSTDLPYLRASTLGIHSPPHHRSPMSTSTMSSVSCYVKDVLRTKRLSPPNPILESLPSAQESLEAVVSKPLEGSLYRQHDLSTLPKFSILQPHHLEKAAEEIARQHDVELAQLEVRWTSVSDDEHDDEGGSEETTTTVSGRDSRMSRSLSSVLLDLDRLTAPVVQLREVSELYETLASPPDKIEDWTKAAESVDSKTTKNFVEKLYRSRIVYRALAAAMSDSPANATSVKTSVKTHPLLVPFLKRGAHIDIDNDTGDDTERYKDDVEGMQQIQEELSVLNERLDNVVSYDRATKAMRLQCMSDMYNCIGLSRMQAQSLLPLVDDDENNSNSAWDMARLQHNHMVESPEKDLFESLFPDIASSLESFLPKQTKLDLEGVGAFLEGKSEVGNAINSGTVDAAKTFLKAKFDFKQRIRLHGVLKGFVDFCDQILGIVIVEDTEANNKEAGWSKNVRLLHLYQKAEAEQADDADDAASQKGDYLGTIYFDPFADSYWRTEDAKDLVKTRLFSQQATGQTTAPVAVVALKITPIWDDTPVPMTWKDTRDLLHQFGKALQLVLDQSRQQTNYRTNDYKAVEAAPIDTSDFLAHVRRLIVVSCSCLQFVLPFVLQSIVLTVCALSLQFLELWLQNDGFLHRLAQLSQDEMFLDDETLKALRKDLRNDRALELTNTMFLSALQFAVFESFDPRGDETLVALQERLAVQYLPGSNLPDPSDLSPLLAVFQESGLDQKMSAYGALWSEVLASTVYESFQKTDLRDREEVQRLGTGIRDLFLRGNQGRPPSRKDFADLCRIDESSIGSAGPLKRVYGFEVGTDDSADRDQ